MGECQCSPLAALSIKANRKRADESLDLIQRE